MKHKYIRAVEEELQRTKHQQATMIQEQQMSHLPEIVRKYIRLTGFADGPQVLNFRAEFAGGIRFKPKETYMTLRSVQYNFTDKPARLFFIKARKMGLPFSGLHLYKNAAAIFKIKIMGLFTVVDAQGEKMDRGETVTVLNDMCMIAPGTLTDQRIRWEELDALRVKAVFTNESIVVSAILEFNAQGELQNFISDDRYETNGRDYKNYPWLTPVKAYKNFGNYRLPAEASLIYRRPEGDFCYGEFKLKSVQFNCSKYF